MSIVNSNVSQTGLVAKYIGTAYDIVKNVEQNLTELALISEALEDGRLDQLIDIADELESINDDLIAFRSTYYGVYDSLGVNPQAPPTEDPYGEPMTDGDLYYDGDVAHIFVWANDTWMVLGAIQKAVEHFIVSPAQEVSKIITLETSYVPGQNNVIVYVDGVYKPSKNAGALGVYTETNAFTLTFDAGVILDTNEVVVIIGTEVSTVKHVIDIVQEVYTTTISNEQIITLPNDMVYVVGDANLDVYLDRRYQLVDVDYDETSPRTITFAQPLYIGQEIIFKKGAVISNTDNKYDVLMQTEVPGINDYNPGQIWYETDSGRTFILYEDSDSRQWVGLTNEDYYIDDDTEAPVIPPPGTTTHYSIVQDLRPDPLLYPEGTQWFKNTTGELFFNYYDGNSAQWIKVST